MLIGVLCEVVNVVAQASRCGRRFFGAAATKKKNESLSLRRKQYSVTGAVGFCDELVEVKDRTFCKKNIAASITDSGLIGVRKMNPGIWHEHGKRQSPDVQRVASET